MTDLNNANVDTYILAGQDDIGAYEDLRNDMHHRGSHVKVLSYKDYPTIEDAVRQIKSPANIILATHGGAEGTFGWSAHESLTYQTFFAALPRQGIAFVSLGSCFGGKALKQTSTLPTGTVLQSFVGDKAENFSNFAYVPLSSLKPTDMILAALGATDPKWVSDENGKPHTSHGLTTPANPITPDDVLPHTIAIGGHPPAELSLDKAINAMAEDAKAHRLNLPLLDDARKYIKQFFPVAFHNPRTISADIDSIAQKIASGQHLTTPTEQRIGYALAVSYLNKSGLLQRAINDVVAQDTSHHQPSQPVTPQVPPPIHPQQPPQNNAQPPEQQPQQVAPPQSPPQEQGPQEEPPVPHHRHGHHRHHRHHHHEHEHERHHRHHHHLGYNNHGMTDEQVAQAQALMLEAGYHLGHFGPEHNGVDAKWGRYTEHAYEHACRDLGLDHRQANFRHPDSEATHKLVEGLRAKASLHHSTADHSDLGGLPPHSGGSAPSHDRTRNQ